MGWNQVWQGAWWCGAPGVGDVPDGSYFYFVHSFYAKPSDARHSVGEADYGGALRRPLRAIIFLPPSSTPKRAPTRAWRCTATSCTGIPDPPVFNPAALRLFRPCMLLIPAIDLKDGHCVRLKQGDMDQSTTFGEDPAAMAASWVDKGARACIWWT
jgi:hypothetical protein